MAPTLAPELKMPVASARSLAAGTTPPWLYRRGKIAALAQAQREARQAQFANRIHQRVAHR